MSVLIDYAGHAFPARGVGPGDRLIVWVRGCPRACPGCMAPELWEPGTSVPVDEIAALILPELKMAAGLTVSGGEPLDQPEAIAALVRLLRSQIPDLEVLAYTGYSLEEARTKDPATVELLGMLDILIDGPFVESHSAELQWRGSDNQRVRLLSEAAQKYADDIDAPWEDPRPIGVQMHGPTEFKVVGIPKRGDIERYREIVRSAGIDVGKRR